MTEHEAERPTDSPAGMASVVPPPEGPAPPVYRLGIGSISDVVFGLALSIGSLILVSQTPSTGHALALGIFYFGFSFLAVILVWLAFRRITVILPYETQATLTVNVALLFCISIEPFLFYVMVTPNAIGADASMAFGVDFGVMMLLLSALGYLLLQEEQGDTQHRIASDVIARIDRSTVFHIVIGAIFLVSASPVFWTIQLAGAAVRYDFWYLGMVWIFAAQARSAASARGRGLQRVPSSLSTTLPLTGSGVG